MVLVSELPCGDSHIGRRGVMGSEAAGTVASPHCTLQTPSCASTAAGSTVGLWPRGLLERKLNAETCPFDLAPGRQGSPMDD